MRLASAEILLYVTEHSSVIVANENLSLIYENADAGTDAEIEPVVGIQLSVIPIDFLRI